MINRVRESPLSEVKDTLQAHMTRRLKRDMPKGKTAYGSGTAREGQHWKMETTFAYALGNKKMRLRGKRVEVESVKQKKCGRCGGEVFIRHLGYAVCDGCKTLLNDGNAYPEQKEAKEEKPRVVDRAFLDQIRYRYSVPNAV